MRGVEVLRDPAIVLFLKIGSLPVLFSFYLHIYSSSIDLLYFSNVVIPLFFLFVVGIISGVNVNLDREFYIYAPFLIGIIFSVLFFNYGFKELNEAIKYTLYVLVYLIIIKKRFSELMVYRSFVIFIAGSFIFMFLLYVLCLNFEFHLDYRVEDLNISSNSAYVTRSDWQYSLPFYLLSFPINIPQDGILGMPRFYGFSTEPTLYSSIILPTIFLAYKLRMYVSSFLLVFALLVTSSYSALLIFVFSILFSFAIIHFNKISLWIGFALLIAMVSMVVSESSSPRVLSYVNILKNILVLDFTFWGAGFNSENREGKLPFATIALVYKYGFLAFIGYFYILYRLFKKVLVIKDYIVLSFFVSFVLILNKSGEVISPLFLFYISFISYNCKAARK